MISVSPITGDRLIIDHIANESVAIDLIEVEREWRPLVRSLRGHDRGRLTELRNL